jgi:hypothetical protein
MRVKLSAVSDTVIYNLTTPMFPSKKCVDGIKFQTGGRRDKTL